MQIRPTIVIPLKPTAGTFWILLGVLFLAYVLIRADPDYKSEVDAEREISLKFRRGSPRPASPPEEHMHPHGFNPYWVERASGGQLTPIGLTGQTGGIAIRPIPPIPPRPSRVPVSTPAAETESGR